MKDARSLLPAGVAIGLIVFANPVAGQDWQAPRTPDGQPNIEGFYTKAGIGTGREDNLSNLCPEGVRTSCYDTTVWYGGDLVNRLELELPMGIIDPPDGRPPLRPSARAFKDAFKAGLGDPRTLAHVDTQDRCLHPGVPATNFYLGLQISQGAGYVTIYSEFNHILRLIPLDERPRLGPDIQLFGGESIGRWDGNTLIVETKNISVPRSTGVGILDNFGTPFSDAIEVVERFTVMDANTLAVEITVDDPETYTQPWTTAGAFVRAQDGYDLFEFACHEGNYGLDVMTAKIPKRQ